MSDTPRTDAEALKWGPYEGQMNVVIPADFARQLERAIYQNNAKVKTRCDGRTCNDRAEDSPCPTCPMEYWIEI